MLDFKIFNLEVKSLPGVSHSLNSCLDVQPFINTKVEMPQLAKKCISFPFGALTLHGGNNYKTKFILMYIANGAHIFFEILDYFKPKKSVLE